MLALNAAGVLSVAYSPEWEHLSNGNAVLNSLIVTIVSPQLHVFFLFAITGFHLDCIIMIASYVMITGLHHMLLL